MSENSPLHRAQPWQIREEANCFIIVDAVGFPVGRIFIAEDEQRRAGTGQMSRDQAWEAAEKTIAVQSARAAPREIGRKLEAGSGGRPRKPVPRILN